MRQLIFEFFGTLYSDEKPIYISKKVHGWLDKCVYQYGNGSTRNAKEKNYLPEPDTFPSLLQSPFSFLLCIFT